MSEIKSAVTGNMWEFTERHAAQVEPEAQRQARVQAERSNWPLSPASQNQLLTFITKFTHATSVISVGTGSVLEALSLAAGLEDDGQITAVDSSARGISAIRAQIAQVNAANGADEEDDHADRHPCHVTLRAVNASPSVFLPRLNPSSYDLIVVSGDKANYQPTFEQASYLLKEHGIIMFTDMMGTQGNTADTGKAEVMQTLLENVENSEDFISVLTPTGSGLLTVTRA